MENPFEILEQRMIRLEEKLNTILNAINASKTITTDEYWNVEEAAEFLHLSKATMYAKVCKMELPSHKFGKRLFFKRADLERFIEKGRRKTIEEIEDEARAYLVNRKTRKK